MRAMDAVRKVMEESGLRHVDFAYKLGIKSQILSSRYTQKNVSVEKLNEMLSVLNYKIVIMPKVYENPKDSFTIE